MSRRLLFLPFFLALVLSVASQASLQDRDYEMTVTNVMVWVKATDKSGQPIEGLNRDDFELYEDGEKVDPTCFELTVFAEEHPEATQESEPLRKHIVFLVDLSNTAQNELLHIKEVTADFLKKVSASWSISLVSLYNGLMEVNVESSVDRLELEGALQALRGNAVRDLEALNNRRQISTVLRTAAGGRRNSRMLSETCEMARDLAHREKTEARLWLDALRQFDRYIKKQSGDSHAVVLFLSGGISSNPGRQYFDLIRSSELARAIAGDEMQMRRYFPECDPLENSDLHRDLERLIGMMNTNNITFYTVSTRGPINEMLETIRETDRRIKASDLDFLKDYQDFLARIADDTGGTAFLNSLNFDKGFDSILADLNHQYLLCYKPPEHSKSGYHKIKVKSKRSGVKLRHRAGYFEQVEEE